MLRVFSRHSSLVRRPHASVWWPSLATVHGFALASVISNAVIISTGAAVRLSSSGLGCPDWPQCTKSSAVAAQSAGQTTLNTWIEFGNRLLNFPLVVIAGLTFIVALRYSRTVARRTDLVRLSAVLPLGVVAQAVVGGIVVLTRLNPAMVAAHFLLSAGIILSAGVVLHARSAPPAAADAVVPVRRDLRVLTGFITGVTTLMLTAGTVVTGTGPLAGTTVDENGVRSTVPRFHFTLASVTQLHADIGWFIGALVVAAVIGLRYAGGSPRTVRLGWIVLCGIALQGVIGYLQYFNHLPAGLVWFHVAGSVTVWIFVLQLFLSTSPEPATPDAGAEPVRAAGAGMPTVGSVEARADLTAPKTTLL
jgi:cytochrome c oxidase assembly protein subunit 15